MSRMVGDLVLVGFVVRVLLNAVQVGIAARGEPQPPVRAEGETATADPPAQQAPNAEI